MLSSYLLLILLLKILYIVMFCYLPGEQSLTTSQSDYVPSIFPKSPKTPTKASANL